MTSQIGTVTGREIKKNRDSTTESTILQAEITSKDDVQSIEMMQQAGVDNNPPDGSRVIIINLSDSWKIGIAVNDGITPKAEPGEVRFYSQDGGVKKSVFWLKKDGSIDITAAADVNITGNLNVTGDVIADSAITAISLIDHYHQGNLGFPTGTSIMTGGGTTPGSLPSTNASGDIIGGDAVNLSTHTHTQPNDGGGDVEQPTSAPV